MYWDALTAAGVYSFIAMALLMVYLSRHEH